MMTEETICFYHEWLLTEKQDFRILALLADTKSFSGSLTDLCKCLHLSTGSRNRKSVKDSIESLEQHEYIQVSMKGRTYTLSAIPQTIQIEILRRVYKKIINHEYDSRSVAWEQVLKVYVCITEQGARLTTNDEIAGIIGASSGVVSDANHVLSCELGAIDHVAIHKEIGPGVIRTIGQVNTVSAF